MSSFTPEQLYAVHAARQILSNSSPQISSCFPNELLSHLQSPPLVWCSVSSHHLFCTMSANVIAHTDFNFFLIPLVEMLHSMVGTDCLDGLLKLSKLMEIEICAFPDPTVCKQSPHIRKVLL